MKKMLGKLFSLFKQIKNLFLILLHAVDAVKTEYDKQTKGEPLRDYHKGNVKARMRMIAQYAIGGQEGLACDWNRSCC